MKQSRLVTQLIDAQYDLKFLISIAKNYKLLAKVDNFDLYIKNLRSTARKINLVARDAKRRGRMSI